MIGTKVTVLTIEHRHGTDSTVHLTTKGAEEEVALYCREWWDAPFMGTPPSDPVELVEDYFLDNEQESFVMIETRILP